MHLYKRQLFSIVFCVQMDLKMAFFRNYRFVCTGRLLRIAVLLRRCYLYAGRKGGLAFTAARRGFLRYARNDRGNIGMTREVHPQTKARTR